MLRVRRSDERALARHGWLESRHSFSFGHYYDPEHMGFSDLRVINQDVIAPATGFGKHPHNDMEILTYVLRGGVRHGDSLGNEGIIRPGEIQRMTAGRGIIHSEANASDDEELELLQIWILPDRRNLDPGYEQVTIARNGSALTLIGSPDGGEGRVTIHQDVRLYEGVVRTGATETLDLAPGRSAWVQVVEGPLDVNGTELQSGDAAAITGEERLTFTASGDSRFLLFDLRG